MIDLLKRLKLNAQLSAALYVLLGVVLLIWPQPSARLLCAALGLVLILCALIHIAVFFLNRDGSLYASVHLVTGVILAAVGIWLLARPTLLTVVIPRVIGVLVCIHGLRDIHDARTLWKNGGQRWTAALLLGIVTLLVGGLLVFDPFQAFTTVARVIGIFLIYDGISGIWITTQVSKAVRQAEKDSNAARNAVDVEYRDVGDE